MSETKESNVSLITRYRDTHDEITAISTPLTGQDEKRLSELETELRTIEELFMKKCFCGVYYNENRDVDVHACYMQALNEDDKDLVWYRDIKIGELKDVLKECSRNCLEKMRHTGSLSNLIPETFGRLYYKCYPNEPGNIVDTTLYNDRIAVHSAR